ncbi:hypothetical protein TorRG33x02_113470 [Trema orientale]|uniref:Uncharacterized protein n=1 Tax=Trema orientale TaxID=63057 RepID=A0A2P5F4T5_TREOI|nr:hypothetical protein TorRG33x02_113470 [Trema orientale]
MYLPTIYQIQDSNQSRSKQKTRVKLTSKHRIRKNEKNKEKISAPEMFQVQWVK